jgi:hypothetical protein
MVISINITFSQNLSSAKGISIGAFTSLTDDINSIDWNAAGLTKIKDWEINLSNYATTNQKNFGLALNSLGVGKRFLENHAAAFRYSPGFILEFIIPTTFTLKDSNGNTITTRFDKKISYTQNYSFGYSYRMYDNFSIGFAAKYFESNLFDTKYYFGTNNIIQSQVNNYTSSTWTFDIGSMFELNKSLNFGLVFKNLFTIGKTNISESFKEYLLHLKKVSKFSVTFKGLKNITTGLEGDTKKNLRVGTEVDVFNRIQLSGGVYTINFPKLKFEAGAIGIGLTYDPVQLDVSYLMYSSQTNRSGKVTLNSFKSTSFTDIDYTPFTSNRLSISAKVNLGKIKNTLARIEYVDMLSEVFPASSQIYAFRPLGKARVRNVSSQPINAKVSFFINDVMDTPTETKPYTIAPEELIEIPFYAVFNDAINSAKKLLIYDGTVYVLAEPTEDYDDRYQTRVLVRGKNDWNGDVMLLKYFVTPSDPEIVRFSRNSVENSKMYLDTSDNRLVKFRQAQLVFDKLSERIQYIHDPKQSMDYVQYPAETISLRGGDCDDISVCYSSLLASVGISTAFIDVVPPDNQQNSHTYMMFDSEVLASDANLISDNFKRFIIRKNNKGIETVWIPVETTETAKGFFEAWNLGSKEYFQDVIINDGLSKGWLKIVDLQTGF